MKKKQLFSAVVKLTFLATILCVSCMSYAFQNTIRGNGELVEESRETSSFSAVKATEGIEVILNPGNKESIQVKADENVIDYIVTEIRDNQLYVHVAEGVSLKDCTKKVFVTYIHLTMLKASSGGQLKGNETLKSSSLEVSASSGGIIELKLAAEELECDASSGGIIEIGGSVTDLDISASSGGVINASNLDGVNCIADASSGGILNVGEFQSLEADASSGGIVNYIGNPIEKNVSKSSGGNVSRK